MKKLLLLTFLVSFATLGAFWAGKKTCLMMTSTGLQAQKTWYADLGLSADQEKSLKELEGGFRQRADALCMQVCREKQNLLDILSNANAPRQVIEEKIEVIGKLQTQLEKEVVSHIFEVRKFLTPSQNRTYRDRIQRQFQKALKLDGSQAQCAMMNR